MDYSPEIGRRFWYEFDLATKYNPTFMNVVINGGAGSIQSVFAQTRLEGTYPANFLTKVSPHKAEWQIMADAQTKAIADHLGNDANCVQSAFEDFGQGVLLDKDPIRQANHDAIHTMDIQGAAPPIGYHRWHASIRAIQMLKIGDNAWWETLDKFLGLAWGIQSFARPKQQLTANPPISQQDLQSLRDAWLPLTPEQRDSQYDLTGEDGYHPSPKNPSV